jgi:hypothetical protein
LNNGLAEQRMKKTILLMKGELWKHRDCVKCIFFLHNVETLLLSAMSRGRKSSYGMLVFYTILITSEME